MRNMTQEEAQSLNDSILEKEEASADLDRSLRQMRKDYKASYGSSVNLTDGEFFINQRPLPDRLRLNENDLSRLREAQERQDLAVAEYNYLLVHLRKKCAVPFNAKIDFYFKWVCPQGQPLIRPVAAEPVADGGMIRPIGIIEPPAE